jgi:pSer/pThr/pTyr-binding forkhead associated (FHA) protein
MNSPIVQVLLQDRLLQSVPFTGERLRIGRMRENDLVIDNLSVSRFHAALVREGERVVLEDSDSENGCYVNGKRVEGWAVVEPGDEIRIGKHVLVLREAAAGSVPRLPIAARRSDPWDAAKTYLLDPGIPTQMRGGAVARARGAAVVPSLVSAAAVRHKPLGAPPAGAPDAGEDSVLDLGPPLEEALAPLAGTSGTAGQGEPGAPALYPGLILQRHGRLERVLCWDQERLRIGRDPSCEIRLDAPGVSRQHALLVREGDCFEVHDLDSTRGIRVRGERAKRHQLAVGDVIRIEEFELTFLLDRAPIGSEIKAEEARAAASVEPGAEWRASRHDDPDVTRAPVEAEASEGAPPPETGLEAGELGGPLLAAFDVAVEEEALAGCEEGVVQHAGACAAPTGPRDARHATLELRVPIEKLPPTLRHALEAVALQDEESLRLLVEIRLRPPVTE